MRALAKILLYLLVVLAIAVLLSPQLYWLLHERLDFPFYRYFTRTAQIAALILLVPLLLWLRIRSFREFGLERNPRFFRDLTTGLSLALTPVTILGLAYLFFDVYRLRSEIDWGAITRILTTAFVVAAIEEFLFRGVVLGLLVKPMGRIGALVLVSAVFAGVHFLRPGKEVVETVEWWSGFAQIPHVIEGMPEPAMLAFGFLSLFVVGMILGLAALRTRSLWLPIRLHAGWVIAQQALQMIAKFRIKPPEALLPWIGPNVVSGAVPTGLVPVFVLLISGLGVWFYLQHASARRP